MPMSFTPLSLRRRGFEGFVSVEQDAPTLVVIDTFAVWGEVEDENDAMAVTEGLKLLTALAQHTQAAVLLVDHSNKQCKGPGDRTSQSQLIWLAVARGQGLEGSDYVLAEFDVADGDSRTRPIVTRRLAPQLSTRSRLSPGTENTRRPGPSDDSRATTCR